MTFLIEIPNEYLIAEWARLAPRMGACAARRAMLNELTEACFSALHFAQSIGLAPRN